MEHVARLDEGEDGVQLLGGQHLAEERVGARDREALGLLGGA
jgi:hypothetical protein